MSYALGMLVGIGCGIVVVGLTLAAKQKMGKKCEFDERQEIERGRGFKYGFFTIFIYNLIYGIMGTDGALVWCEPVMGYHIGALLGLSVFGVYCIWKEAYVSVNETPAAVYTVLGVGAAMLILIGISDFMKGRIIVDGKLTEASVHLFLGIVCVLLLVTYFVRNHVNREEECEE